MSVLSSGETVDSDDNSGNATIPIKGVPVKFGHDISSNFMNKFQEDTSISWNKNQSLWALSTVLSDNAVEAYNSLHK